MKLFDVYPLLPIHITKAKGSYVWDENATTYLDMYGGHAVISIGHTHPHWVQKIQHQLQEIPFYSNSVINTLQIDLASLLGKVSGKEEYRLFLCNSGAEANENALKLASFHTGRKHIVAFSKAFHGRTSLAVSVTDYKQYRAPINETELVSILPFNDSAALKTFFQTKGSEVAAVIVEGIQGVGGIHVATKEFLTTIRELCTEYGAVYIADSIQCGYGRTGHFYSHDYANTSADIYTMAKGMGNGFPIAGLSIAPHIQPQHGMLGTTFGGNHLACAAAIAVLEVIEQEQLLSNAIQVGTFLLAELNQIQELKNVRGRGLMIGFDLPDDLLSLKKHLLYAYKILTGEAGKGTIRLLPSMALSLPEAKLFIEHLRSAINDIKNTNT